MKRFDDDDDDDLFPDTEDGNVDDGDYAELVEQNGALELMQLNLAQLDINQRLLFKTIKMLSRSWFWRFRRPATKLKMIRETYLILYDLVRLEKEDANV